MSQAQSLPSSQPDPAMPPLFQLKQVGYRYGAHTALAGVSFQVGAGERIALLGANGSGKSTLLRLLDALYFASSGEIEFAGKTLGEKAMEDAGFVAQFRRRVGLVFQNPDVQLFNPTVLDELAFGPLQLGWERNTILERAEEWLERLELTALRHRSPHRLSGGEKKRVALASVLIMEPEVLLLDEPTAALDPQSQSQIIDLIAGWSASGTVITATHDLATVPEIAGRVLVFQEGALVADGRADTILADQALLGRTHLVYSHRHRHPDGTVHSHPHSLPHLHRSG